MTKIDTTCEHAKIRLIAAAQAFQSCTQTDGTETRIPGTDKRILIGNDAYLEKVALPAAPASPEHALVPLVCTPEMRAAWDRSPQSEDDDVDFHRAYRAMIDAAPSAAAPAAPERDEVRNQAQWQPIATAPMDGSEVLLYLQQPFSRIVKARWFDVWENWIEGEFPDPQDEYCGIGSRVPTHWMPLPAAPGMKTATNEGNARDE